VCEGRIVKVVQGGGLCVERAQSSSLSSSRMSSSPVFWVPNSPDDSFRNGETSLCLSDIELYDFLEGNILHVSFLSASSVVLLSL